MSKQLKQIKKFLKDRIEHTKKDIENFKEQTYKKTARKILENEFLEIHKRYDFRIENLKKEYSMAANKFFENPHVVIEKEYFYPNIGEITYTAYFQAHNDFCKVPMYSRVYVDERNLSLNPNIELQVKRNLIEGLIKEFKSHITISEKEKL